MVELSHCFKAFKILSLLCLCEIPSNIDEFRDEICSSYWNSSSASKN